MAKINAEQPLWNICKNGIGAKYVELNNTVGQRWYFPFKNSKIFLSLFQPSSVKGKIIERAFSLIKILSSVLHIGNPKIVKLSFLPSFQNIIDDIFKQKNCKFGVFCGSPGKHQKPTIIIVNGNRILGYCKLTDNETIFELFKEESENLTYLHNRGVENVPCSLFCGWLEDCNSYAFVQSTKRTDNVKTANRLSPELFKFISDFNSKTEVPIEFEKSEFFRSIIRLRHNLHLLNNPELEKIYLVGIDRVLRDKALYDKFCAYHGDLTPWNSFIVDGEFFAFDLEYFKNSYPLLCDYFHFFTQDLIYNNYANADIIYKHYTLLKNKFSHVKNIDLLYLAYLLVVTDFYLYRDKGVLNARIGECFIIWSELITKLLKCDTRDIK